MILIIDNYDSFTYNLYQCFIGFGKYVQVVRNDKISISSIETLKPDMIVISPGPGIPVQAGNALEIIKKFFGKIPIFGVCLGHQCIAEAFGSKIIHASRLMHGKTTMIYHDGKSVYRNIPNPFEATRYHSLIVERETLSDCFEISSWTDENEIMGIRHKDALIEGVQFHPESILTHFGKQLLRNTVSQIQADIYAIGLQVDSHIRESEKAFSEKGNLTIEK